MEDADQLGEEKVLTVKRGAGTCAISEREEY